MSYTVATVIANVQRSFPDLQTTRATDLVNMVHREILAFLPEIRRDALTAISPVSGQAEYSLVSYTDTVFQVGHIEYVNGSVIVPVVGTTVEALDQLNKTWRSDPSVSSYTASGENGPQFYLSTASSSANQPNIVIGFYPTPAFTAGAFNVYASQLQATDLISSDVTLFSLYSPQVYVAGVCYWAAAELRPELAGAWKAAYAEELKKNRAFVRSKNGDLRGTPKVNHNPRDGDYPEAP